MSTRILVLVERDSAGITETSCETLTFARELADQVGGAVDALLVGAVGGYAEAEQQQLSRQGVARAFSARSDVLASYCAAGWAACVVDIVHTTSAGTVLAPGTSRGNEILAHVATRLDVAMGANVVAVDSVEPLVITRQVAGGSALEEMRVEQTPAVFSVAGHAVAAAEVAAAVPTEFVSHDVAVDAADARTRVVRVEQRESDGSAALAQAKVVVGAGRGVGRADGFTGLLELTDLLGGALGVSRVITSLGWRPHHEQVGQTGSRVSPDLYLACGISGAIQHWAGMSSSKTIVAINTDPDAPMVTKAHYAVIGDLHEIVPAVNEEIRRRRG